MYKAKKNLNIKLNKIMKYLSKRKKNTHICCFYVIYIPFPCYNLNDKY